MIQISLETRGFYRKTRALSEQLGRNGRTRILRRLGVRLRDAVRRRFTTQGNGRWAPLSAWTIAKTGRRKALLPLREKIQYDLDGDSVSVFFDGEGSIQGHHEGFVSPPVEVKKMAIPLRSPHLVGASGSPLVIHNRGASVIPARRIWLTQAEIREEMNRVLDDWAAQLERA